MKKVLYHRTRKNERIWLYPYDTILKSIMVDRDLGEEKRNGRKYTWS